MSDTDQLRQEAEAADRSYNEALTAVDSLFVPADETPAPAVPWPDAVLPPPSGPHRPWLRVVHRWLAPVFARQRTFDNKLVDAIDALSDKERQVAFARFETALIIFLQKITAFVESKDRLASAVAAERIDRHEQLLAQLPDVQSQLAVLQRATQSLLRQQSSDVSRQSSVESQQSAIPTPQPPTSNIHPASDFQYVAFEDRFRGSDDEIREKLRAYVPLFADATDVLDVGCGRGEFLALLAAAGISARGVDTNAEMVAAACDRGLNVVHADALAYLESLPDESLGGLMASQVVEHLTPAYLTRLLAMAFQKLRPSAPIVVETINPACWLAFFSSYIRDFTHAQPIHPETLQYLLQASGFGRARIQYSQPVPEHIKMQPVDAAALAASGAQAAAIADMARTLNANAAILNNLLFSYYDYAAIGYRS
jgi:O-antigen chain-terminating methyltransferase